jgi:hypothetical protein
MVCIDCERFFANGIVAALLFLETHEMYGDKRKYENMSDLASKIFEDTWKDYEKGGDQD